MAGARDYCRNERQNTRGAELKPLAFLAMSDAQAISERVANLLERRATGKPRRLICREAGISYKTLADLLAGETIPRYQTAEKLARYLGVTPGYIYNGSNEPDEGLTEAERLAAIEAQISELIEVVRDLSAQVQQERR